MTYKYKDIHATTLKTCSFCAAAAIETSTLSNQS
jgi:hypothetical protein